MTLGYGNPNRDFVYESSSTNDVDVLTTPYAINRMVSPYASFIYGWGSAADVPAQEWNVVLDNSIEDGTTVLYPCTPVAHMWLDNIWPVMSNLLQSGTGTRYSISVNEFIRYQARLMACYADLCFVLNVNYLAYHFDWTQVYPFTPQVPPWLYDIAANLDATNIGLADRWVPLMERMETKIMMPNVVQEIKRVMTPFIATDMHARVVIPVTRTGTQDGAETWNFYDGSATTDADNMSLKIANWLDYIDVNLIQASAVIRTFLPFNLVDSDPWSRLPITHDPLKYEGFFNSGMRQNIAPYGDTNDPEQEKEFYFEGDKASGGTTAIPFKVPFQDITLQKKYFALSPIPVWGGIRYSSCFAVSNETLDDGYALLTDHLWAQFRLFSDNSTVTTIDDTDSYESIPFARIMRFIDSRFVGSLIQGGVPKIQFNITTVQGDAIWRNQRLQVESDWSLAALTYVTLNTVGSSLREIRTTIRNLAMSKA